ncbi:MAG: ribosome silencing factor [Cytophagales bacterium]|nr:MAG: ribosome silencing factor [Cytophagales bacterium]
MKNNISLSESDIIRDLVVKGMEDKKGENIVVIDLKKIKSAVADYFIICTGTSGQHIDAVTASVEDEVFKGIKEWPRHNEGRDVKEWILLDYINVVVHVFTKDIRTFFGLEQLWGDADIKQIN